MSYSSLKNNSALKLGILYECQHIRILNYRTLASPMPSLLMRVRSRKNFIKLFPLIPFYTSSLLHHLYRTDLNIEFHVVSFRHVNH